MQRLGQYHLVIRRHQRDIKLHQYHQLHYTVQVQQSPAPQLYHNYHKGESQQRLYGKLPALVFLREPADWVRKMLSDHHNPVLHLF